MKTADPEAGPIDRILALAREIIEDCPSCAGRVSENALWAGQIRERRPDREELVALVRQPAARSCLTARRRTWSKAYTNRR
jgi:hypothetical protein